MKSTNILLFLLFHAYDAATSLMTFERNCSILPSFNRELRWRPENLSQLMILCSLYAAISSRENKLYMLLSFPSQLSGNSGARINNQDEWRDSTWY